VAVVRPEAVTTASDGQPALDLRAGIAARLAELGVHSTLVGGCTAEDPALYSHRRDGLTGRQAGAVAMVEAA
jgi:copper oxidase (laccase) domain-containing protein